MGTPFFLYAGLLPLESLCMGTGKASNTNMDIPFTGGFLPYFIREVTIHEL